MSLTAMKPEANLPADFWRGMRNLDVPQVFKDIGGTEYAPMSTSSDYRVALAYTDRAEQRLLFKVKTRGFMDRGADLQYLSAFPDEIEFLYPPLTFLAPTGYEETVLLGGVTFTIIEVIPTPG